MYFRRVALCVSIYSTAAYSFGTYGYNGQTRLLGSSFGVPGINATFDYVVSACTNFQHCDVYLQYPRLLEEELRA